MPSSIFDRAATLFQSLQTDICATLEALEPTDGARFGVDPWRRDGGGGGVSRVLQGGEVFEKAGVGWSSVHPQFAAMITDPVDKLHNPTPGG